MTLPSQISQDETLLENILQDDINAILWKACDTFRGTVDPSEYKNYILVMLFVKYISDVWLDHYEQYKLRYGDDETRLRCRMDREKFKLPAGTDFYSLYEQRNETNLGEIIDMALAAIEEANVEKLAGVFRNISFNSETALGQTRQRNARLKNLLTDFHDPRLDMRPSRINGMLKLSLPEDRLPEGVRAKIAEKIEAIIEQNKIRDWSENPDVHDRMGNAIEDYLEEIEDKYDIRFSNIELDEITEQVIDIARKRA